MSAHTHREFVEGCFRCDLSRQEALDAVLADARRIHGFDLSDDERAARIRRAVRDRDES